MKTTLLTRISVVAAAVAATGFVAVNKAQATTEIGTFTTPASTVVFTNAGAASGFNDAITGSFFTFAGGTATPVTLDLVGTVSAAATETYNPVTMETEIFQPINLSETFEQGSTVLFSANVTGTGLLYNSSLQGTNGTYSLDYDVNDPPATVLFSSPYADWTDLSASLSFTSLNSPVGLTGGYLSGFSGATLTGTYSGVAPSVVPEPNPAITVAIAAAGLAGLVLVGRRKSSMSL